MFESHDSTESNDYHLQRCPVADRELAAAESHALVHYLARVLDQYRLRCSILAGRVARGWRGLL